jgi:hypothetical protein
MNILTQTSHLLSKHPLKGPTLTFIADPKNKPAIITYNTPNIKKETQNEQENQPSNQKTNSSVPQSFSEWGRLCIKNEQPPSTTSTNLKKHPSQSNLATLLN